MTEHHKSLSKHCHQSVSLCVCLCLQACVRECVFVCTYIHFCLFLCYVQEVKKSSPDLLDVVTGYKKWLQMLVIFSINIGHKRYALSTLIVVSYRIACDKQDQPV